MSRIRLISLGCSKNRVDSEHLLRLAQAGGYTVVPEEVDPLLEPADTVVINTCGFIGDAKEESVNTILEAVRDRQEGRIRHLFVMGCLAQRYRSELPGLIPEVDGFFGVNEMPQLLQALHVPSNPSLAARRYLTTPAHYAYLKISEGCDRRCSYCAIPLIRGPHVSVPLEVLEDEARSLAGGGVRELILIAQDTTYYGMDLYGRRELRRLIDRISEIDGIERIRLHYSYPEGFPQDVLEAMATNPKLCPYLDIPLQHSEDAVLRAMRRHIDGEGTRRILDRIREAVPGVVLRTTLMVGHPGEGEAEFERLLDFVREYRFERLGAFRYSEEEGTWGAEHLKDEVPEAIKQERYDRLMEVQSGISEAYNVSRIGTVERVLADSYADGVLVTRSRFESPEVDGEILVGDAASLGKLAGVSGPQAAVGTFFDVKIVSAGEYDLLAEVV
ncbi:MAG: 30S ribosomal protein S12 methylthiotransferase RimO [Bacteroidales bacterium]|nr:30S ribosomal protein S12 methylthiotransferase RimO [Bacteroidales bacterium]